MTNRLPAYMITQGTMREYRQRKRRQVDAAIIVVQELYLGSAYMPCDAVTTVGNILEELLSLREHISQKSWGK